MKRVCILSILAILSFAYLYYWGKVAQPFKRKQPSLSIPLSLQGQALQRGNRFTLTQTAAVPTRTADRDTLLSPEEWERLREAISWPSPDRAVPSLNDSTDPARCSYHVPGLRANYTVGDSLEVALVARDFSGRPKRYGGDFFQAKLHSPELRASTYGSVSDHRNGSYTVRFTLLWPGPARIALRLIHSSEAVQVLRGQRDRDPNRVYFRGYYVEGGMEEAVVCNAQKIGSAPYCEYRDPATGEMWFCQKPARLPCHALVYHSMGGYQAKLSSLEQALLSKKVTDIWIRGDDVKITVLPPEAENRTEQRCVPGLDTPVPAGFYFQDRWTSLVCATWSFPNPEQISSCLRNKQLYMMGDSTLRQWFEYLEKTVPTLKQLDLHTSSQSGPLMAVDPGNNVVLHWRAHGLPIRTLKVPWVSLHYIANELDGLAGGAHTVVVFTLWAHFTTFPPEQLVRRVASVRRAVVSLLHRSPSTLVVIKSANTGYKDVYGSDWLSLQLDVLLRRMFQGLPVVLLDVWQMTSCQSSPDNIHPPPTVIRNEVDMFLSFVCPP
ncbi:NXPE family member 3-like [Lepisosteus oculatus]|uniref:NXPE family member 3-like n=1 Tax=Lepisosteus oculatus TaxID=7918 RepID=UPI00073FC063|nr:PREDICTED: NXPE family member 3-like [Lepisosteus oculatus]XP_015196068.1 PREDICTED: NXPE family member 3-like [Lepisosteus oculatus]